MADIIFKKCMKPGCLATPTHVPSVCVPKRGIISRRSCYEATLDIPLCAKHVKEPTVREMLSPALQQMIVRQVASVNGLPPDFSRAYMNWEPMAGAKYQEVLRRKTRKGLLQ